MLECRRDASGPRVQLTSCFSRDSWFKNSANGKAIQTEKANHEYTRVVSMDLKKVHAATERTPQEARFCEGFCRKKAVLAEAPDWTKQWSCRQSRGWVGRVEPLIKEMVRRPMGRLRRRCGNRLAGSGEWSATISQVCLKSRCGPLARDHS